MKWNSPPQFLRVGGTCGKIKIKNNKSWNRHTTILSSSDALGWHAIFVMFTSNRYRWLYMHTGAIHTYIQGSCPQLWRYLNSSNARGSKDVEETEACAGLRGWVLSRKMFQFHDFSHCRRTKNLQERFLSWCGAASKSWHAMTSMKCWVDVLGPPLVDLRTFKAGKCRKTSHKTHLVTSPLLWFWFPAEFLCQFLKFFVFLPEGLSVQEKPRLVWVWDGSLGVGWIPKTWTKSKDRTRLDSGASPQKLRCFGIAI